MAANYANLSSSSSSNILDDSNVFSPRNTTTISVKRENPYYEDFDSNVLPVKRLKNEPDVGRPTSVLTSAAAAAAAAKKLSKVETLRAAAEYIKYLHKILNIENPSKDTNGGQGASNCNNNSNFAATSYRQPANHFSYCNNENLRYNNAECCDHNQASLFSSPCSSTGGGASSSTDTSPQIIMNNFYANEAYHQQTWYY
uniref:BHLH domain-containing protein n=1 Tax=Romanomermis culicivorax TaxID=13658 RepID=A0A915IEB4_ROMCU